MKIMLMLFLVFIFSCTTPSKGSEKDKYIQMNELWKMKASRDEVKEIFGTNFTVVDFGITYSYPNSKFPEMGFFFDSSNKLREQFVFMQEKALAKFKSSVVCKWKETEEVRDIAHYQRTVKKGSCPDLSIGYETYLDLNAYEVRWKR